MACCGGNVSEAADYFMIGILDVDDGTDCPADFLKYVCALRPFKSVGWFWSSFHRRGRESTFLYGEEVLPFFVFGLSVRPRFAWIQWHL